MANKKQMKNIVERIIIRPVKESANTSIKSEML